MAEHFALVVHGGAGAVAGRDYAPALERLRGILEEVGGRLASGLSCLDAVVEAVAAMEDSGLYTAGRGSAPNAQGEVELDASLMEGASQRAGAIAAVRAIKNPVRGARAVMENSEHVLLAGTGAERFLRRQQCEFVDAPEAYFQRAEPDSGRIHGTVGAVALDGSGRLAAATSTGGIFNKLAGRVGDSPIPGAGVWADARVGVSCTGHGEFFIRTAAAHAVAERIRQAALADCVEAVLRGEVARLGGDGGMIAIDAQGHVAARHVGWGMKHGWITHEEGPVVALERGRIEETA